eukprot:2182584-Rhodomonas_salina.2
MTVTVKCAMNTSKYSPSAHTDNMKAACVYAEVAGAPLLHLCTGSPPCHSAPHLSAASASDPLGHRDLRQPASPPLTLRHTPPIPSLLLPLTRCGATSSSPRQLLGPGGLGGRADSCRFNAKQSELAACALANPHVFALSCC